MKKSQKEKVNKALEKALRNRDVDVLAKWLFDVDLAPGQQEIVESIVYPDLKRVAISAMTRYGKTFATAVGILIYIYLNEDKKVYLLAPTNDQAKILRNEVAKLIVESPQIQRKVDDATSGTERLKKEVSKKRITFKNGCSIETLSAEGSASRIMGKGGHLNVVDESCLIKEEVYNKRIFRMLGDGPNSKLVELSNPWHKKNQFYKHWTSDRFKNIHIDYKQALEEGRVTEEFIQEARETLTPQEFTVLYESDFPEDTDETLIPWDWIQQSFDNEFCIKPEKTFYGVDVSRKGNDLTVVTKVSVRGSQHVLEDVWKWKHETLTHTAGKVMDIVGNQDDEIRVDGIGVGGGVVDILEDRRYNVREIKVNKTPEEEKHRFRDQKAEGYFNLRGLFERNEIAVEVPLNEDMRTLQKQLNSLEYEFNGRGKIQIRETQSKSPDHADSLMLASLPEQIEPYYGILD